ncbi:MAG: hypothetical protein VW830_09445 [Rhodobiaceae bacterium]
MEDDAVIKPVIGKFGDARDMVRRKVRQEFDFNLALGRFKKQGCPGVRCGWCAHGDKTGSK